MPLDLFRIYHIFSFFFYTVYSRKKKKKKKYKILKYNIFWVYLSNDVISASKEKGGEIKKV